MLHKQHIVDNLRIGYIFSVKIGGLLISSRDIPRHSTVTIWYVNKSFGPMASVTDNTLIKNIGEITMRLNYLYVTQ